MSLFEAIGNTPLIQLGDLNENPRVKIFCKLEGSNPGGSVKDRPAYYMIKKAEENGELVKEKTIIEPTSGNMGIALAMIGAAKGYKVKLYMPECVSIERRQVLAAFGAEIVLTPAREGIDGAIRAAHKAMDQEPAKHYMPNQFENKNNTLAHYEMTGPEIFNQTRGAIDIFIAGLGTTGTLMGAGRFLKEKNPKIKIIGVEPVEGHTIQGLKNMNESIVPAIYNPERLDAKVTVDDGEAFEMARSLAMNEGLFVGMSSGAAVSAALTIAQDLDCGTMVVILPDKGDRYLSTTLFRSVCAKCPP